MAAILLLRYVTLPWHYPIEVGTSFAYGMPHNVYPRNLSPISCMLCLVIVTKQSLKNSQFTRAIMLLVKSTYNCM